MPTNSDDEFGKGLGAEPVDYPVPADWADHVDKDDGFWVLFPNQLNPPEDIGNQPRTVPIRFRLDVPTTGVALHVWASFRNQDQGERLRRRP